MKSDRDISSGVGSLCEFPDHTWDDAAAAAFEDALENGGFAPGEEDGDV